MKFDPSLWPVCCSRVVFVRSRAENPEQRVVLSCSVIKVDVSSISMSPGKILVTLISTAPYTDDFVDFGSW